MATQREKLAQVGNLKQVLRRSCLSPSFGNFKVKIKSDESASKIVGESPGQLAHLADTAKLLFVGSTYQKLATPNPRTCIGSGNVGEIKSAIEAFDAETVIFDDELLPWLFS